DPGDHRAHPVHMALDQVPAEAVADPQRALQVDRRARGQVAEAGAAQRLGHHIGGEVAAGQPGDGEAGAVDGDGVTGPRVAGDLRPAHGDPGRTVEMLDGYDLA